MFQAFTRFVEIGRVIIINYGKLIGKAAVIVDLISTTKVLIDGPKCGIRRQEISIRRLILTDFKLNITRGIHKDALIKAIGDFKLEEKIKNSNLGKKAERRNKRLNNTDFDRFKVKVLRQKRAILRGKALKSTK